MKMIFLKTTDNSWWLTIEMGYCALGCVLSQFQDFHTPHAIDTSICDKSILKLKTNLHILLLLLN